MKFVTYSTAAPDPIRAGVLVGNDVVDAAAASAASATSNGTDWASVKSIVTYASPSQLSELEHSASEMAAQHGIPLDQVTLAPPIPNPNKILCIGLNYLDHVEEAQREQSELGKSKDPVVFSKFNTALIGDRAAIIIPDAAPEKIDWEGELAVVLGRGGSRIPEEEALSYVAGYTIFNDVSARDVQLSSPQWLMGKSFDTSGPCGPILVTADEVGDPQDLTLETRVNGELVQSTTTALMIHPIRRLIAYISSLITLEPGDIIATGNAVRRRLLTRPTNVPEARRRGDSDHLQARDTLKSSTSPKLGRAGRREMSSAHRKRGQR